MGRRAGSGGALDSGIARCIGEAPKLRKNREVANRGFRLPVGSGDRKQGPFRRTRREWIGKFIDLISAPDVRPGRVAAGSIHHIAFRVSNDEEQIEWRKKLVGLGYQVSPILDRIYFHSIYFREPGGMLFELATDPPGFI